MQDVRRKIPAYADPIYRPPPKQTEIPLKVNPRKHMDSDINMDFEENSPYQEDVISETYQRSNKSYFQEPPEFQGLVSTGKLVRKVLHKQANIEKILKIIQGKILKGTHLPVTVKEILAAHTYRFILISSTKLIAKH